MRERGLHLSIRGYCTIRRVVKTSSRTAAIFRARRVYPAVIAMLDIPTNAQGDIEIVPLLLARFSVKLCPGPTAPCPSARCCTAVYRSAHVGW